MAKVCSLTPNSLLLHRTIHHMFIQLVPPVKRSATKLAIILKTPRKMFVFYVILSMRLLAKTSATHCTLELHLAVLRLIFLNVIDKHLSGLTCKLRIADIQHQYTHTRTHSPNITHPRYTQTNVQEMPLSRLDLFGFITFVSVHGLVEVHNARVCVALLVLVLPVLCVVLLLVGGHLLLPSVAGGGGQGGLRLDRDNFLDVIINLDWLNRIRGAGPLDWK